VCGTEPGLPYAPANVVPAVMFNVLHDVFCKYFVPGSSVVNMEKELGFKQSFLRGHAAPVGLIEVSVLYW
jgi:hypothetical protein